MSHESKLVESGKFSGKDDQCDMTAGFSMFFRRYANSYTGFSASRTGKVLWGRYQQLAGCITGCTVYG